MQRFSHLELRCVAALLFSRYILLMMAQVLSGGAPNQHGTWAYGRNGWCDGQNVRPWVADVTDNLKTKHSDAKNVIEYLGLFNDHDPDPEATPGYIMMESSLILEGSFPVDAAAVSPS